MKEKLTKLLVEYGRVALIVYVAIFALVFAAAAVGLKMGFEFEGTSGNLGTFAAAYAVTKVAQPVRILATVALTPVLAAVLGRKPAAERDDTLA